MTQPNKIDRTEFAAKAAEGLTPAQLATHFGISDYTVWKIRNELGMPVRKRRAKIDRDELLRLHEQGKSTTDLAKHFGANDCAISRIKKQLGISQPHDLTPERIALAAQRLEDGWSFAEIHRTDGIGLDSLRRYFPGKSWTPEQAAEYRALRRQETGRHFNERNNRYRAEHRARTHPVGATNHPQTGTHTLRGDKAAQNASQGHGGVMGHAA